MKTSRCDAHAENTKFTDSEGWEALARDLEKSLGVWMQHAKEGDRKLAELERENAALKQALNAQADYRHDLRADRDRLDWLLTHEGRTWFCQKLDSGEWIKSMGSVRGFIDAAMADGKL